MFGCNFAGYPLVFGYWTNLFSPSKGPALAYKAIVTAARMHSHACPQAVNCTHRPLSSSFLGLPYTVLNINHEKELLRGLWVNPKPF